MTCPSFDSAFHWVSLRPATSAGLGSLKVVALALGSNSSLRSAWPGATTTTDVRFAGALKLISMTGGEAASTAPFFGVVPATVVCASAATGSASAASAGRIHRLDMSTLSLGKPGYKSSRKLCVRVPMGRDRVDYVPVSV